MYNIFDASPLIFHFTNVWRSVSLSWLTFHQKEQKSIHILVIEAEWGICNAKNAGIVKYFYLLIQW